MCITSRGVQKVMQKTEGLISDSEMYMSAKGKGEKRAVTGQLQTNITVEIA